jgi:MerR family transcriptional regulator, redox-sensitive transcriptional activator SoxR
LKYGGGVGPTGTAHAADVLTIGELARRSGTAPSALRFYEAEGLLHAERNSGGQRRYARSTLRRVAFIRAAQRVGLSLEEIRDCLRSLPESRTPTRADWVRLSGPWRARIDARIAELEQLRDGLTSCIGCGCLSLRRCALSNPRDVAGADGPGARYLLDEEPYPDQPGELAEGAPVAAEGTPVAVADRGRRVGSAGRRSAAASSERHEKATPP